MMTRTTPPAAEERADARFYEQIAAHYRDYLAYLEAQLALLDIQASRTSVAFERAEAGDDEERAARATLANISPASRALFDAVVEQERLESGQDSADPDEALREALRVLRDEAQGIGTEGGKGLLPRGKPEAIRWYAVDVAALRAAPTAAAYAAGPDRRTRQRIVWQAGAAIAVILLALVWLFIPKGAARPATGSLQGASANGTPLTAWSVQRIVLTASHGDELTLPVSTTTGLGWPSASTNNPRAYWRSDSVWPLRLCVPATQLANLAGVRVIGGGAWPERRYTIAETSPASADLLLEACQSQRDAPAARVGLLRETIPVKAQQVGETAALPQGPITVTAIALTGPGEDPSLPADTARVSVRTKTSQSLDWPVLAPTLLLPSGAALSPSDTIPTADGAELRYLIPLPGGPTAVVWSITPGVDAPQLRWRATLERPPSRAAVLRDALAVDTPHVTPGETPGTILATIRITNRRSTPLQLSSADISLMANNRPLATPDLPALRQRLGPHEQRTVTITAPLGEHETLILSVGVSRFAVERAEGR